MFFGTLGMQQPHAHLYKGFRERFVRIGFIVLARLKLKGSLPEARSLCNLTEWKGM